MNKTIVVDGIHYVLPAHWTELVVSLEWFEKDPGDALIGETELDLTFSEVRRLFGLPESDPLDGGIPVSQAVLDYLPGKHDAGKYDYFISVEAK